MPTEHIVALLIAERDRLNRAIEALHGPLKRRGRPPRQITPASAQGPATGKKRKVRTVAQRKAQAERMRAYWANRKKQQKSKG